MSRDSLSSTSTHAAMPTNLRYSERLLWGTCPQAREVLCRLSNARLLLDAYESTREEIVGAVASAAAGNVECEPASYGNGCPGSSLDADAFVDDLMKAGWRIVRAEA